jgi:hypothetical protein
LVDCIHENLILRTKNTQLEEKLKGSEVSNAENYNEGENLMNRLQEMEKLCKQKVNISRINIISVIFLRN